MRILQVSAELFPLLKTGGLADVTGALPAALARAGCEVRVVLPGFPAIVQGLSTELQRVGRYGAPGGGWYTLLRGLLPDQRTAVYVVDAPELYDRPGNPYVDARGQLYDDSARRFAVLGHAGASLAAGVDQAWMPDVMHAHDWHAGLAPAYLAYGASNGTRRPLPASVYTVHNLAYQGVFDAAVFPQLGLPRTAFTVEGLEFYGQVSFMKAGLQYAQRITTVSPTYAREIQTPEQGCGLDGLLRARAGAIHGVLNGVDEAIWNPATDRMVAARFDAKKPLGKARCKAALQHSLGLAEDKDALVFGLVSRLAHQKGLSLVLGGLPELLERGGQLVLLGSGEPALEAAFREAAKAHPKQVAVHIGYDEPHSHAIFAGTDVTLVPSLFEPCGLTQMYGLKYGSLPLVRRVGGLADTVVDCTLENLEDGSATGFVFERFDQNDYLHAMRRAFALHRREADWRRVRRCAMEQVFGWDAAAHQYLAVYRQLVASI